VVSLIANRGTAEAVWRARFCDRTRAPIFAVISPAGKGVGGVSFEQIAVEW